MPRCRQRPYARRRSPYEIEASDGCLSGCHGPPHRARPDPIAEARGAGLIRRSGTGTHQGPGWRGHSAPCSPSSSRLTTEAIACPGPWTASPRRPVRTWRSSRGRRFHDDTVAWSRLGEGASPSPTLLCIRTTPASTLPTTGRSPHAQGFFVPNPGLRRLPACRAPWMGCSGLGRDPGGTSARGFAGIGGLLQEEDGSVSGTRTRPTGWTRTTWRSMPWVMSMETSAKHSHPGSTRVPLPCFPARAICARA